MERDADCRLYAPIGLRTHFTYEYLHLEECRYIPARLYESDRYFGAAQKASYTPPEHLPSPSSLNSDLLFAMIWIKRHSWKPCCPDGFQTQRELIASRRWVSIIIFIDKREEPVKAY
ncbi:hypothetical protein WG66_000790 [Moniliophthora roreri]|nr:hypothetical protein WG66_000790 [Moniliophthora roreri]